MTFSERLVVKHHELLLFLCLSRSLLSPDGSYTEDHSAELHFKSRSEFDDDFDDEEPLPSIGTCKSLYPFQGSCFVYDTHSYAADIRTQGDVTCGAHHRKHLLKRGLRLVSNENVR